MDGKKSFEIKGEKEDLPIRLQHFVENCQWEKVKETGVGDAVHFQKRSFGKGRRILLVTGTLKFNCDKVMKLLFDGAELLPQWNPRIVTCKILKTIDKNTDITYQLLKGITGLLSPRDFITQRQVDTILFTQCDQKEVQIYAICSSSTDYPETPGVVRGEQGLGGWILYKNGENQTDFQWVVNMDIKLSPWIPYKLIENLIVIELFEIVGNLRKYLSHQ